MLSPQVLAAESSQCSTPHRMAGLDHLRRAAYEHGLVFLWKDFESKLSDLFVDDATDTPMFVAVVGASQCHRVVAPEELCAVLGTGMPALLILKRYNSWSRIDITLNCFSVACDLAGITPYFLHFVVGMVKKFSSKDEDFMSCYSTRESESDEDNPRWGICCNIRYFERHNRDLEDPWSCRQSALHHSLWLVSSRSTWVVIQPPECFKSTNQRIAIPNPLRDFKIDFSHEQNLHRLRGKLHHARTILVNTKDTLRAIAEHECAVSQKQDLSSVIHNDFQCRLNNISREIGNYIETSCKLLHMSEDLGSMYENILTFRGQELQHDTSLKLAHLVQDDAAGNRDMAVLADLTHKDSRAMRIATAIAMFYLPANLVVGFFSSTLVWYGTAVEVVENHSSSIQIRGEVWIASIAVFVLAMGTVGWSWWWNGLEQKKSLRNAPLKTTGP
ncbi:hypothetical protein F4777DRAFT_404066 [Nemania sp. FL0916]|nr:hypothetical protein F4777DRAFT_404066 [Nemania sp. FL0916]